MKRLISLMLGVAMALGSYSALAQDATTEKKTVKIKRKGKKTVKKETTKTEGQQN